MTSDLEPLVVGLGSSHGDDQAGWLVVASLHARGVGWDRARAARSPAELWDWFQPDRPLILCDACETSDAPGTIRRWLWPAELLPPRGGGTHDLALNDVLALGRQLESLPEQVTVWTIAGRQFQPAANPSPEMIGAAGRLAGALCVTLWASASLTASADTW